MILDRIGKRAQIFAARPDPDHRQRGFLCHSHSQYSDITILCQEDTRSLARHPAYTTGISYRHAINRNVLYTDGAQHLAEHGGAYWLLDEIAIIQPYNKAVAAEEFQVWKLAVRPDRNATLTCDDGNGNIVFTKEIEYTDFPLDEITLYFANNVIHLPSEN
jgi:hypothetical protein